MYKVVQIWPGLMSPDLHTNSPGHIWTTLYVYRNIEAHSYNSCCRAEEIVLHILSVCF